MTKTNDKKDEKGTGGKKTLSLGGTLSLKGGAAPSRTPSSSSGVAVEVRRKRTAPKPEAKDEPRLTSQEREARAKALELAKQAGDQAPSSLPKRHTIESVKKKEAEKKAAEDNSREKEMEELKRIEEEENARNAELQRSAPLPPAEGRGDRFTHREDKTSYRDRMKQAEEKAPPKRTAGDSNRRGGRITVTQAINQDYDRTRGRSLAAQKRAREKARMAAKGELEPKAKVIRDVVVPEIITVGELANRMAEPTGDVIKTLMKLGVMATITENIDADTAELVISEFGHTIKRVTEADVEIGIEGIEDSETDLKARPPVVTIMGHVDHGKTSLLDALRQTDVVAGEAGGITQHIGAYQVTMNSGDKITFLDTPGHAAFTEMRARGANVTDIVVIVVAADDSIMPQTIEAISHAKAAGVPIIVAINKIDLPAADPMRVKTELLQYEVIVEELSGDVQCIEISAKQKINLDKLEEAILLQAEVLELKANPDREAHGVIVESKLEKGRGSVATVLIQKGTLRVGDVFVAGAEVGKVRALINDHGKNVDEAIPGQPVEVLGLNGTPDAGDMLNVVPDEGKAREISSYRQSKKKKDQAILAVKGRTTIEQLVAQKEAGETTSLPVIIKADVHGSVEAIIGSLNKMVEENEGIAVQVLHNGVGGITESDVTLAGASKGIIVGFNVRANAQARDLAQKNGVDIRYYNVIYDVIDDAKSILTGMLSPNEREEYLGQAKILQVFNITKVGKVAGCVVEMGSVKRGAKVRLLRDDVVIHEGKLKTLKRHKDEVPEVKEGTECGMAFENYDDIKEGDVIECFEIIEEARKVT
ncbi:MAG: translation initiation factor IF-2 [Alphaproteobacteria bacterium]|nr:translation initiation factor IF-2 [Alphaproteobacteria bacterium]